MSDVIHLRVTMAGFTAMRDAMRDHAAMRLDPDPEGETAAALRAVGVDPALYPQGAEFRVAVDWTRS